jgi:hypothetical protein
MTTTKAQVEEYYKARLNVDELPESFENQINLFDEDEHGIYSPIILFADGRKQYLTAKTISDLVENRLCGEMAKLNAGIII